MRSYYQGLRLQFRPTLRRCVSDDFFQYNQGLHVRSCEYLELVVSASAVLADAGVDVCGADWDVEAPAKLLIKLLMIAKSTYFQIPLCQWGFSPSFLCCLRYVKLRSAIDGFFVEFSLPSISYVFTGIDPGMVWIEANGTVFLRRSKWFLYKLVLVMGPWPPPDGIFHVDCDRGPNLGVEAAEPCPGKCFEAPPVGMIATRARTWGLILMMLSCYWAIPWYVGSAEIGPS